MTTEWSNSRLYTLEQCGEKFRRRYLEGERLAPSPRMIRGTVVHRVAHRGLDRVLHGQALPSVEEARDTAATEFRREWETGVTLEREDREGGTEAQAEATSKDFAVALSAYHVARVAPGIRPVAIERKVTVRPQDSDLVIHGTIDLIDGDEWSGETIRDLKTSEKSPNRDAADRSQQLSLYSLIRWAETKAIPESLALDYLVRTPARHAEKHVTLTTQRSAEDLGAIVARLNVAAQAVAAGIFVPAPPEAWWCAESWCEFYLTCPYTARGVTRPRS